MCMYVLVCIFVIIVHVGGTHKSYERRLRHRRKSRVGVKNISYKKKKMVIGIFLLRLCCKTILELKIN